MPWRPQPVDCARVACLPHAPVLLPRDARWARGRAAAAGKTTLLNALAGQLPRSSALALHGAISVNGVSVEASQHRQGYVQQEDIFFSQLTVK